MFESCEKETETQGDSTSAEKNKSLTEKEKEVVGAKGLKPWLSPGHPHSLNH